MISGDVVSDVPLVGTLNQHRVNNASLTVLLKRIQQKRSKPQNKNKKTQQNKKQTNKQTSNFHSALKQTEEGKNAKKGKKEAEDEQGVDYISVEPKTSRLLLMAASADLDTQNLVLSRLLLRRSFLHCYPFVFVSCPFFIVILLFLFLVLSSLLSFCFCFLSFLHCYPFVFVSCPFFIVILLFLFSCPFFIVILLFLFLVLVFINCSWCFCFLSIAVLSTKTNINEIDTELFCKKNKKNRYGSFQVTKGLFDAHIYIFSKLTLDLIVQEANLSSLKYEVIPFLINKQHEDKQQITANDQDQEQQQQKQQQSESSVVVDDVLTSPVTLGVSMKSISTNDCSAEICCFAKICEDEGFLTRVNFFFLEVFFSC